MTSQLILLVSSGSTDQSSLKSRSDHGIRFRGARHLAQLLAAWGHLHAAGLNLKARGPSAVDG